MQDRQRRVLLLVGFLSLWGCADNAPNKLADIQVRNGEGFDAFVQRVTEDHPFMSRDLQDTTRAIFMTNGSTEEMVTGECSTNHIKTALFVMQQKSSRGE